MIPVLTKFLESMSGSELPASSRSKRASIPHVRVRASSGSNVCANCFCLPKRRHPNRRNTGTPAPGPLDPTVSDRECENYLGLLSRLLRLDAGQRDRIARELRDHMEQRLADLMADGVSRQDGKGGAHQHRGRQQAQPTHEGAE